MDVAAVDATEPNVRLVLVLFESPGRRMILSPELEAWSVVPLVAITIQSIEPWFHTMPADATKCAHDDDDDDVVDDIDNRHHLFTYRVW